MSEHQPSLSWLRPVVDASLLLVGLLAMEYYGHAVLHLAPRLVPLTCVLIVILCRSLVIIVHELGHGLIAKAVGFRFQAVIVGPVSFSKTPEGHLAIEFEWERLLGDDGYWGAVPKSAENVRSNSILVSLGGPLASLVVGVTLWLGVLNTPDTAWEVYWDRIGVCAVLFSIDFLVNLIPVGDCDGTVLFHLSLWTQRGQDMVEALLAEIPQPQQEQPQARGDFAQEVELCQKALDKLWSGNPPAVALGRAHAALGVAQLNAGLRVEAEQSLVQSLMLFHSCSEPDPLLEANSWMVLYKLHVACHRGDEANRAYESAISHFEQAKLVHPEARVRIQTVLAELHADEQRFEQALKEIRGALDMTSSDSTEDRLMRARLLTLQALCEYHLAKPDSADRAAQQAATLLQADDFAEGEQIQAALDLSRLGSTLWIAGRFDSGAELAGSAEARLRELGLDDQAATCGIRRAAMIRKSGGVVESEEALPDEASVRGSRRVDFFEERGDSRHQQRRLEEALEDYEEAYRIAQETGVEASKVAMIESKMANALLDDGRGELATLLALKAYGTFAREQHPEAATALVTLALVEPESAEQRLAEALRLIEECPRMEPVLKAHALELLASRMERHGQPGLAEVWREAATRYWQALGVQVISVSETEV